MKNPFKKLKKISKKDLLNIDKVEPGEIKIFIHWKNDLMTSIIKPDTTDQDMAVGLLVKTAELFKTYLKKSEAVTEKDDAAQKGPSYIS